MLIRKGLRVWEARTPQGEFIDYVVATRESEAATIAYQISGQSQISVVEVDPTTGAYKIPDNVDGVVWDTDALPEGYVPSQPFPITPEPPPHMREQK